MVIGALAEVPVDIDRDTARLRAIRELTDPAYQAAKPNPLLEAFNWVVDRFNDLLNAVSNAVPGGIFGLLLIVVLLIVLVVVVRLRVGKVAKSAQGAKQVFEGRKRSADEYRRAAAEAASKGEFADAVRERFRALVRDLEQRSLLDERSGRTADEAAAEAGALLPAVAERLRAGARLFDDVHYGGLPASADGYQSLVELDERCRRERPVALVRR
ncbi:DUF4129 domain-containing protein [Amycolatopsis sp. H20-H5]|uniref:DUF4129 domain-containing protein n=1 Tax=Amycolatopsis sp. H20-H5 TaxID=3046309 RepID=UPI002DBF95E1|nr:DUF4129 domain-containing protein [Amycolatopsis sp. H20-H5]MEC3978815.1 DUF4129 domain-containing protein [Amycolatopsis sp. H20-H5]